MTNQNKNLSKFIKIALLGAMAIVLMMFEFPMVPLFPWLKVDISEVPVLMGAFAFGPMAGVLIEVVKILLNFVVTGTMTFGVGELANFIIGISFVVPAAYIYHRNKSKRNAIIGMIVGTISVNVFAIFANIYLLLPAFGMTFVGAELVQYVVVGLLPTNTVKAVVVSLVTFIVYKKVSATIFKVEPEFGNETKVEDQISTS